MFACRSEKLPFAMCAVYALILIQRLSLDGDGAIRITRFFEVQSLVSILPFYYCCINNFKMKQEIGIRLNKDKSKLADQKFYMIFHNFQFIFLSIAYNFLGDILNGLDKVLEFHMDGIRLIPHNFDKDEMVVILGNLITGHTIKSCQLRELRGCEHPFASDTALTVEKFQNVFNYVHVLDLVTFGVKDFLIRIKMGAYLHVLLFFEASTCHKYGILNHYSFHIFVNGTELLFYCSCCLTNLMLNVEGRVVIGLKKPWIEFIIHQNIDAYNMEVFPIFLGESGIIVVLEKGIEPSQKFLSQFHDPVFEKSHIHTLCRQVFPYDLKASLSTPAERMIPIHILGVVLIQAIVGEMNV